MTLIDYYLTTLVLGTSGTVGLVAYLIHTTKMENKQAELLKVKTSLSKAQLLNHLYETDALKVGLND